MNIEIGKVYKSRDGRPVRCVFIEETRPGFTPFAVFKLLEAKPLEKMVERDVIRCFIDEVSEWNGKDYPFEAVK